MGDKLKTKGNRKGKKKVTIVGENTSKVKTDSSGRPYVTVLESTTSVNKGDTVYVKNKDISDGYLTGGDYRAKKTGQNKYTTK
tara:strand:+ start:272 stop:520 length:249 start_codon:yes stop_codon:yes gene_type:complete